MNRMQVSVDLAKSVFQLAESRHPGRVDAERRLTRGGLVRFFANREPVEVLLEACGTAHHWGRQLEALGHRVTLLPARDVSRYRAGSKTDRADTRALLEAARNRAIRPVPVKSVEQQAVVALHRLRSGYVATRTARINAVRGHLREFSVSIPLGARRVGPCARAALKDGVVPEFLRRAGRATTSRPSRSPTGSPASRGGCGVTTVRSRRGPRLHRKEASPPTSCTETTRRRRTGQTGAGKSR